MPGRPGQAGRTGGHVGARHGQPPGERWGPSRARTRAWSRWPRSTMAHATRSVSPAGQAGRAHRESETTHGRPGLTGLMNTAPRPELPRSASLKRVHKPRQSGDCIGSAKPPLGAIRRDRDCDPILGPLLGLEAGRRTSKAVQSPARRQATLGLHPCHGQDVPICFHRAMIARCVAIAPVGPDRLAAWSGIGVTRGEYLGPLGRVLVFVDKRAARRSGL